jgi:uncharacterized protein (DUF111 family)
MPSMQIDATGFGAGGREIEGMPNVAQVVLGAALAAGRGAAQPLSLLEANLDDVTGEILSHAVAALLEAGALDAWMTPVLMKKGRPGHVISALVDPVLADQVAAALTVETGTLGVRSQMVDRWAAARSIDEVEVEGLPVRIKVSAGRVKAEHADAARAARRLGLPIREVARRAEQQAHLHGLPPAPRGPADGGDTTPDGDAG